MEDQPTAQECRAAIEATLWIVLFFPLLAFTNCVTRMPLSTMSPSASSTAFLNLVLWQKLRLIWNTVAAFAKSATI